MEADGKSKALEEYVTINSVASHALVPLAGP